MSEKFEYPFKILENYNFPPPPKPTSIFCINCKHVTDADLAAFAKCARSIVISPVTGESSHELCLSERTLGSCGPNGKFYEAKSP